MIDRERRKGMFDLEAEEYDAVRPGYAAELFQELEKEGVINSGDKALEIGCGSGQATERLADYHLSLTGIDPSENMLRLARAKFADRPSIQFQRSSFEDYEGAEESLDLVIAATAWHWIDPEVGYRLAARLLKQGGHFAIVANLHPVPVTEFFNRIQAVYRDVVPEWGELSTNKSTEDVMRQGCQEMIDSGLFSNVKTFRHQWKEIYSRDKFLRLIGTYSDHRSLEPERLQTLKDGIGHIIDNEYQGVVERAYVSTAYAGTKI